MKESSADCVVLGVMGHECGVDAVDSGVDGVPAVINGELGIFLGGGEKGEDVLIKMLDKKGLDENGFVCMDCWIKVCDRKVCCGHGCTLAKRVFEKPVPEVSVFK
jgi:hypothetical protein